MNKNLLQFLLSSCLLVVILTAFSGAPDRYPVLKMAEGDTTIPYYKARDHQAKSVTTSNGVITLTTGFDNDHYLVDSFSRKVQFYVETKVSHFQGDSSGNIPLNLSIVIDRSGSMQGVKMGFAKKAAKSIIDRLHPEDYVSIVIYDNYVDSVQSPVKVMNKELIKKKIDGIVPRGSTNLWGGTELGYEFVKRNFQKGYINRVLLISDGLANAGITDSGIIRSRVRQFKDMDGITISTFGVGLDYNEELMTDMAETGAGNYYFIDAPEKMAGILNRELTGLLTVAAREAELKIQLPDGAKLVKGYPLRYTQEGNEISIKLRDIFSDDTKAILFQLSFPDSTRTALPFITSLHYNEVKSGQKKSISNKNLLQPVRPLNTWLTRFNKPVIEQTLLFTANENLEKAMRLVDRGQIENAKSTLAAGSYFLHLHNAYVGGSEELRRMDSITLSYARNLKGLSNIHTDSLKKMQKSNKAFNYFLRQKKKQ